MSLQGDVLDCGSFVFEIGPPEFPAPPRDGFCVSRDTGNLVLRQTENVSIRYRDFAPFLDKSIPRTISASKGSQVRFRIKIEHLDQSTLDDAAMTAPPDASPTSPEPNIWSTKPGETTPIHKPASKLVAPPEVSASHASGPVVLYVLISRTGAVIDAEPIAAPTPAVGEFVTQFVRGWTYKPILRNGKPIEEIAHAFLNFNP
jgi:hypothetical protein